MKSPSTLLIVHDLDVSKNFYVNVLGIELIEESHDCIRLKVGCHDVFMFQGTSGTIKYEHGYSASSTLVFMVEHLDEKINLMKLKGVVFVHQSPNQNKWGRYAAFKDPSGIVHELMEFHPTTET